MKDHLRTHKVDLASIQYTRGRRLTVDPRAENFGADRDANRLLTREYRVGFALPTI